MKKEVSIIVSGNRSPYNDNDIYFKCNENFYTIVEYENDGKKDYSVFTDEEWNNFNVILKTFSLRRSWLALDSDYCYINTPQDYKNAVYFFKNSDIDFDDIDVKKYLEANDVYDELQKIKDNDECTINQTRNWISTNYETIQKYYQYLLDN